MQKQKLLFEQSRLCSRGAAEMALMYISASNGQPASCLHLHNSCLFIVSTAGSKQS